MCNLLNLKKENLCFVIDQNKFKQNKYIPGTDINIRGIELLKTIKPKYILIFVWNIKNEVIKYLKSKIKRKVCLLYRPKF